MGHHSKKTSNFACSLCTSQYNLIMIKSLFRNSLLLLTLAAHAVLNMVGAQQAVFDEHFSTTQGLNFTTSGPIGSSIWSVARSGQDFGARISGGMLTLTNDATSASNSNGWVSATTSNENIENYNPVLSKNAGIVSWTFNIRQSASLSGFENGKYGVAFILAGTPGSNNVTGKGYAIQLGGPNNTLRFVRYENGLKNFYTYLSSKNLGNFGTDYTSVRVTYNPKDNQWTLYGRKDGSAFVNPEAGTLAFQESLPYSNYVSEPLTILGAYWNAGTRANQTAFFDNVKITVALPEITSITPTSKTASAPAFTLTVTGKNFSSNSKVQWNGQERPTTYVSPTEIRAAVPATDIGVSGTATITVKTGTTVSNEKTFTIAPSGAPILTLPVTTLAPVQTVQGTASTAKTYQLRGDNLKAEVKVAAPANYEISRDGKSWSDSLTLPNAGGGLEGQGGLGAYLTLSVRVKANADAGVYTGEISHSSAGAGTKSVSVSGKVLAKEPVTTATAIQFSDITSTAFRLNWTNGNGAERLVIVKKATAVNVFPTDGATYEANAVYQAGTNLSAESYVVYKGAGTSVTVTGLEPNTVYHVSVVEFNGAAEVENYLTPGTAADTKTKILPTGLQLEAVNTSYKIDFDSTVDGVNLGEFLGAGISKVAEPGQLDSDSWQFKGFESGDVNFGGNSPEESSYENGISDGNITETGVYAFNVGETAENYTLGIKPGGADFNPGSITLRIHNRTVAPITSLNIGYKVYVKNVEDSSTKVSFSHKLESAATFSDITAVDVASEATADLNPTWKAYYRVVTLTGLNIPADKHYNLRWSGTSTTATAAQDEFGIDDIEVIANPTTDFVAFDGIAEDFVLQGNADLSNDLAVQNRLVFNGGKLAIKDKTLTIWGSVTNTTAGGLSGGANAKLVVRGIQNPSLSFDQTTVGTTNVLQQFSLIGARPNTVSALNNFAVNDLLAVDEQQILNLGTSTLSGNLTAIQNNGIIQTQNTTATPFASGKTWSGTGVLHFNAASAAQTLVAGTYNNLKLSSDAGTTANADVTVNGELNLPVANASATKGSLHMGTFTLDMGENGTNTGIGEVSGIIRRNYQLVTNKLYTFGHPNSSIIFPGGGIKLPSAMSAKLTLGAAPAWKEGAILRQFDIIQADADGTKAIIRQHYLDTELNGNNETKLVFWGHKVTDAVDFEQGKSSNNITDNWVEISNANLGEYFVGEFDKVYITLDETQGLGQIVWNGSVSDSWTTIDNWTPKVKPGPDTKVIIPNASTTNNDPTLNPSETIGSLIIEAGAIVNSTNTSQLFLSHGSGAWQNYGTFNPGTGTSAIIFNHLDATISGSTTFNNVIIPVGGGIRPAEGNYMSIAGTLTNNGTMFTTLIPNTIEFKGTDQTIPNVNGLDFGGYHHLIVSGSGAKLASSITNLNIRGNLTLNKPLAFTGTTVNLAGVADQTIGGTAATAFDNLIVNKETGAVVLAKEISVSGTLTFTKGNVVLGAHNLTLGSNPVEGTFGINTMIVADENGFVRRPLAGIGSYFFPIGENTGAPSYAPISVNVTAGTFSNAFVGVNVKNVKHPNNNSSQNYLRKYWNVQQTGITSAVATITAKYESLDVLGAEAEIAAAQLRGTFDQMNNPWMKASSLSNKTLTFENADLTPGQTSVFTGIKAGEFTVEVYGYGEFCKDSEAVLTAEIVGGDAPYTYIWSNGLPNSESVTVPTTTVGEITYTLTVRDANGLVAVDNNSPVKILPATVGGTVAAAEQTVCAGTIPTDLVLQDSEGKILYWQRSTQEDFADIANITNISNFTTTLSGAEIGPLYETTYFRAVLQNGDCASKFSTVAKVNINSTTWNGTSWNNGLPNASTSAVFEGNYNIAANINACSVTVKSGDITIPAGFSVTLYGALKVDGGSFTLESNTNLIQLTDAVNSGNITVRRNSSKLYRLDYTMWGSPVTGTQTLKAFSPKTVSNRFYTYTSATDLFNVIDPAANAFAAGKGYLIRMPDNHPSAVPTEWTGAFTGIPTNGPVAVTLDGAKNGYNMIANPYASMINADQFLAENAANIDGTLYFWRRRNAVPTGTEGTSAYYATYTAAGGTAVGTGVASETSATPNGFIQVGQGFVARNKTGNPANVMFNNLMRTADNHDNQFFRTETDAERSRIWLNVSNKAGEFGQMLIAYMPTASNDLDRTDGKYMGDGSTALTSWLNDTRYIIQGRGSFTPSDVVVLNFETVTAGNYTIAIDHVDGLFEGSQQVFLHDKFTGTVHDLKSSAYTFATEPGKFNSRFEIVYSNGVLAVTDGTSDRNMVVLYRNENEVVVQSKKTILESVEVFDMNGRLLNVVKNIRDTKVSLQTARTNQVLIFKITTTDGKTISKKLIN